MAAREGGIKSCFYEYQTCDSCSIGSKLLLTLMAVSLLSWFTYRHQRNLAVRHCSPLVPSAVRCCFKMSMWDLSFDNGLSNISLRLSTQDNRKPLRITMARK